MLKRMLCALLCLVLAGSLIPAAARAAEPENTYDLFVLSPEDCFFACNTKKVEDGHYRAAAGQALSVQVYYNDPVLELDHWESRDVELTEEQKTSFTLEFVMPDHPVYLDAVARESVCPFTDVPRDSWYYRGVMKASKGSYMKGTSDTTFSPTENMTRAQAVTALHFFVIGAGGGGPDIVFNDVPEDAWFYEPVYWAVSAEVTKGISDTEFGPYAPVTRAQFVCMLFNAMKWVGPVDVRAEPYFSDVPEGAYYWDALAWALGNDFVAGKTYDTFGPNDPCTRAEIAVMLSKR